MGQEFPPGEAGALLLASRARSSVNPSGPLSGCLRSDITAWAAACTSSRLAAQPNRTIADAEQTLTDTGNNGILLTPYSLREIRLRGLLNTGRAHQAAQLAHRPTDTTTAPAPQWGAIERITTANAFMALGDHQSASEALTKALDIAHRHRLPHQIQRILRTTTTPHQAELHHQASAALQDLRQCTVPGRGR